MKLSIKEVCEKYNVSESSLKTKGQRTLNSIKKKYGVSLEKRGRGAAAYYIELFEDDCRALTIYEEGKSEIGLNEEILRLMNWDFVAFLAIIISPLLTFRGSYKDFLKYIGVPTSAEHIISIKQALKQLEERDFIIYKEDKSTDEGYFVAAIVRSAECDMKTGINMIRKCKEIAENNNKRSWIPLLKVWIGVIEAEKNQPFTNEDIAKITGLSEYQIRESKKLLESNDIFKTKREYIDTNLCLGQSVELNGFYNEQN